MSSLTQLDCWQYYRLLVRVVSHLFTLNVVPETLLITKLAIGLHALLGTLVNDSQFFPARSRCGPSGFPVPVIR